MRGRLPALPGGLLHTRRHQRLTPARPLFARRVGLWRGRARGAGAPCDPVALPVEERAAVFDQRAQRAAQLGLAAPALGHLLSQLFEGETRGSALERCEQGLCFDYVTMI